MRSKQPLLPHDPWGCPAQRLARALQRRRPEARAARHRTTWRGKTWRGAPRAPPAHEAREPFAFLARRVGAARVEPLVALHELRSLVAQPLHEDVLDLAGQW